MSFWVRVYLHPEDPNAYGTENTLVSWHTRGTLRWADELVEAGKLTQTRHDYFPCRYVGLARDLLPALPAEWPSETKSLKHTPEEFQERINNCPPDAEIGMDIWDNG